jgi:hypothetical protein
MYDEDDAYEECIDCDGTGEDTDGAECVYCDGEGVIPHDCD